MRLSKKQFILTVSLLSLLAVLSACSQNPTESDPAMQRFTELKNAAWKQTFEDSGTGDWRERWTLDGLKAKVTNDETGMTFLAGPTPKEDASHAVLWTKDSFQGNLKIEYEYTRLDNATKFVNIIYIQATGSGVGPYQTDIANWSEMREVPSMRKYFKNMNTLHISYAAYGNGDELDKKDYIRARRYLPLADKGLAGTALEPTYSDSGLFAIGIPHKITIIKKEDELFMRASNDHGEFLCHWKTDTHPPITEGRIGLRHMYTRDAKYANFKVSVPE